MTPPSSRDSLDRLAPPLFVVIWASGFIVARLVAPHAEPLTFLLVRFLIAAVILALLAFVARAPWPRTAEGWRDGLVAGMLIHGFYLGAVFWSVKHGLPAGISALIVGLQPLATALLVGPLLGERVTLRRWAGIAVGFAGAALVVVPQIGVAGGLPPLSVAVCVVGMISITFGTIWQKRTGGGTDLRTNTALQYLGAAVVVGIGVLLLEEGRLDNSTELWIGMIWAVFGLSIGAIGLLMILIRRGAVAGVAALLYLVPPVAALMAYALFGEALAPIQIGGMLLAAVGVAIANRA